MYTDDTLVRQALRNGANGYLLKRAVADELLLAVRAVARGDTYLSPEVAGPLLTPLVTGQDAADPHTLDRLTSRSESPPTHRRGPHQPRDRRPSDPQREDRRETPRASHDQARVHDTAALVRFAIKHGLVSLDA